VTKLDLMPYLDFDLPAFQELVTGLNPGVPILPLSARSGEGMAAWLGWLTEKLKTPPVTR
jgi:hydrogenase nickel incorporation protein HypB